MNPTRESIYNGYVKTDYPNPTYTIQVWIANACVYSTLPVNFRKTEMREAFISLLEGVMATEEAAGTLMDPEYDDDFLRISIYHGESQYSTLLCTLHHIDAIDNIPGV